MSWPIPGWSGSVADLSRKNKIGASVFASAFAQAKSSPPQAPTASEISGLLWVEISDDKAEVVEPLAFLKDNASQVVAFMYRRVEVSQSP